MNLENIGRIINERRKVLDLSQNDLCEIAGISQHTLSAIENGTANPEIGTLVKILDKLGIDIDLKVRRLP
ncbi:MAG TPA: helix-turn-helix transcriptional regulator [bacterium]|jgi:transcriptional regulator with XRE-family HTH domain|nr:helix-turn-helix transcriptional regulator [bacterium]HQI05947.1 helix-turn-helix transcriptional regulator [bacterium]HQN73750.1 helix-turn-helix transcriptional regulator [bacterium]